MTRSMWSGSWLPGVWLFVSHSLNKTYAPLVPVNLRKLPNELSVNDTLDLVAHTDVAQIPGHAQASIASGRLDPRLLLRQAPAANRLVTST